MPEQYQQQSHNSQSGSGTGSSDEQQQQYWSSSSHHSQPHPHRRNHHHVHPQHSQQQQQQQPVIFYSTAAPGTAPPNSAWVIPAYHAQPQAAYIGHDTATTTSNPTHLMSFASPMSQQPSQQVHTNPQMAYVNAHHAIAIPAGAAFRLGPVPMGGSASQLQQHQQQQLQQQQYAMHQRHQHNAHPPRQQSPPPNVSQSTNETYLPPHPQKSPDVLQLQQSDANVFRTSTNSSSGSSSSGSRAVLHKKLPEQEMKTIVDEAIADRRNVYIRGLPPSMNDAGLAKLCKKFGNVVSVKTIVEQIPSCAPNGDLSYQPGPCKGYGFALFETPDMAVRCVQEVAKLGYQASFAKESFSSKLKSLRDQDTTNIYLSNLPLCMDERAVEQLLEPVVGKVLSAKILREQQTGKSRGVGFARVATRTVAEECIRHFHNMVLPGSSQPIQLRFADNPAQRKLKGRAHERRNMYIQEQAAAQVPVQPVPAAQLIPVYPACYSSPEDPNGHGHVMITGYFDGAGVPILMPAPDAQMENNVYGSGANGSQNNSDSSNGHRSSSVLPSMTNGSSQSSGNNSNEPHSNSGRSSQSNSQRNVSWSNSDPNSGSGREESNNSHDVSPASSNDKEDPMAKAGKKIAAEYARGYADKRTTHEPRQLQKTAEDTHSKNTSTANNKNNNNVGSTSESKNSSGNRCSDSDNSDNDCDDDPQQLASAVRSMALK